MDLAQVTRTKILVMIFHAETAGGIKSHSDHLCHPKSLKAVKNLNRNPNYEFRSHEIIA